mgnify:CR=1 FL=1
MSNYKFAVASEYREAVKREFVAFRVYDCPNAPMEKGRFVGSCAVLEQAEAAAAHGSRFITGVRADGSEVVFL